MNSYQRAVDLASAFLESEGINPQKVSRFTITFEVGRMPEMQVEFVDVNTEPIFANYTLMPKETE